MNKKEKAFLENKMNEGKEKEPITLEGLFEEMNELKALIMYVIGCQAAIESILQANGVTSHKKINALAIESLKQQKELMQQALCKLKEISDPKM